jgi:hypothetical protein
VPDSRVAGICRLKPLQHQNVRLILLFFRCAMAKRRKTWAATNWTRPHHRAGIKAKAYFLRRGRGSRMVDRVVRAVVANEKAKAAERTAEHAPDEDRAAAEIKALRLREHVVALVLAERVRPALAETRRAFATAPTEVSSKAQASST